MRSLILGTLLLAMAAVVPCQSARAQTEPFSKFKILSFNLSQADANEVSSILNEQFLNVVKFSASENTNTVYGRVPESLIPEVQEFVEDLEKTAAMHHERQRAIESDRRDEREAMEKRQANESALKAHQMVRVFNLRYSDALGVLGVLGDLGFKRERLSLAADQRTNSILVRGTKDDLEEVESLLMRLDDAREPGNEKREETEAQLREFEQTRNELRLRFGDQHPNVRTVQRSIEFLRSQQALENDLPGSESLTRQAYEKNERMAATVARRWRQEQSKEKPSKETLADYESKVKQHVETAYSLRKKLKKYEIDRVKKQIESVERRLRERDRIADRIIHRRVDDLLKGEDLSWLVDSNETAAQVEPISRDEITKRAVEAVEKGLSDSVQIEAIEDLGVFVLRGKDEDVNRVADMMKEISDSAQPPSAAGKVHGTITVLDGSQQRITFSVGSDDGIKKGDQMAVIRDNRLVGRVEVIGVEANNAIARIIDLTADSKVAIGDRVGPLQGWEGASTGGR